jgi:tRNA(Ile)-lysidine synthase TilS/MesJ
MKQDMKRCSICVLPETFPGIQFNKDEVCSHCQDFKGEKNLKEKKVRYRKKFEGLIKEYKGKGTYDALLSYSGGKDSTYTLSLIKERYGLNALALTFDNGFLPEQTITNIRNVTDKLDIDHILIKPHFDVLKKIFKGCAQKNIYPPTTLTRASTICTACMAIVKFASLRTALEKNIPFIFFGWSPGQIPVSSSVMKNNPPIVKMMQKSLYGPLHELVGDAINPYFLEEQHFTSTYSFPYNISPLVFLDYDEKVILEKVRKLGWRRPEGIDANTTNCLLNSYANIIHKKQYGYHPYAFEMAKLVREGYSDRSTALKKLTQPEDRTTIQSVKRKLT